MPICEAYAIVFPTLLEPLPGNPSASCIGWHDGCSFPDPILSGDRDSGLDGFDHPNADSENDGPKVPDLPHSPALSYSHLDDVEANYGSPCHVPLETRFVQTVAYRQFVLSLCSMHPWSLYEDEANVKKEHEPDSESEATWLAWRCMNTDSSPSICGEFIS